MLQIDHEIEENNPSDHFHPDGKMVCVQQAPPLRLGFYGYRQRKGRKQQPDERRFDSTATHSGVPVQPGNSESDKLDDFHW